MSTIRWLCVALRIRQIAFLGLLTHTVALPAETINSPAVPVRATLLDLTRQRPLPPGLNSEELLSRYLRRVLLCKASEPRGVLLYDQANSASIARPLPSLVT